MLGLAKLRRLETDASVYFQRFLQQRSGQNGIKEAYQKLAWCELLKSNQNGYRAYLKTAITQGKAATGADKNALQEAQSGKTPEVTLLKARLLFDGGYLQKAHQQLQTKSSADFKDQAGRLEYFYRMGRILHGLEQWDEALGFYQRTIRQGQNEPYFYACNAALQAGLICEKQKNFPRAQDFYKTCLRLSPSEYKTELHQKAKSGLGRLGD
jgi:tetratricopeptide (TPR) repeat protein